MKKGVNGGGWGVGWWVVWKRGLLIRGVGRYLCIRVRRVGCFIVGVRSCMRLV